MKNKAVFLDRDGTINVDKDYIFKISDFEFIDGAVHALKILQDAGFLLIIVTNQSGIGRGFFTENDLEILNSFMLDELKKSGVNISKIYYCPHLPEAKIPAYRKICNCRKPSIGLFLQAAKEFNIDFSQSYAIGDKERDLSICNNTDCKGFLIGRKSSNENINTVSSLLDAAKIITGA